MRCGFLRAVVLVVIATPFLPAQVVVGLPSWFGQESAIPDSSYPAGYERIATWPDRLLKRSDVREMHHENPVWMSACIASGEIAVFSGNQKFTLPTPYAGITHLAMTDLTAINPIFGNRAVFIAGIRPDGLPQVSVILRNHGDDPAVLPMHHLPTIGNPGETYARVGVYDGMLLVFEAASATIVPFLDTNGDGNPETRAPAMVAFQQPRVPFIKEFQPLDVSCAPGVLSFGGAVLRSTGETDGVIDHQGALIPGRVRVRTATVSQAPSRFLLPPEAGMRSFSMSAPLGMRI
jgi:hypothetical protein